MCVSTVLLSLFTLFLTRSNAADWNYDYTETTGPFYWHLDYELCGGDTQSPIDVRTTTATNGFDTFANELANYGISQDRPTSTSDSSNTFLDLWDFGGNFIHNFEVTNSGHSIKLTPVDGQGNYINTKENGHIATFPNIFSPYSDSNDNNEFCFDSFHFHWGEFDTDGSEHTRDGLQYPAELHIIHYLCKYDDISDALSSYDSNDDPYVLAVMGFFMGLDDDASDEETAVMVDIENHIERLATPGDDGTFFMGDVNLLGNLIPYDLYYVVASGESGSSVSSEIDRSSSDLFYYEGSLTTPTCDPVVRWHVWDYKLKIRSSQLAALRSIDDSDGNKMTHNWRPIQTNINTQYYFQFEQSSSNTDNSDNSDDTDKTPVKHYSTWSHGVNNDGWGHGGSSQYPHYWEHHNDHDHSSSSRSKGHHGGYGNWWPLWGSRSSSSSSSSD